MTNHWQAPAGNTASIMIFRQRERRRGKDVQRGINLPPPLIPDRHS